MNILDIKLKKNRIEKDQQKKAKSGKVKEFKLKSGFTLIEIIVVLFIISLALLGILSLITQSIRAQNYNKKVIIANQLSQEGIELIRRVRDNNWNNGDPFYTNLAEAIEERKTYIMDYDDSLPTTLVSADDSKLQVNDSGFFIHNIIYEDSAYSREIEVELIDNYRLRVISSVYWTSMGGEQDYQIEALLYNWY
ncbi:MAG: prepilin-type N-terminal cleavage/methylation domain-containing protein [Patescibacteria group bacterium]|jgi:prepilin-type N-terminal cleavage/methylation domain-containing protein|nr:prepilin-type N-terminal cleavage/methylation domain-containing protein [Patescibacteria group bacterium]